MTEDEIAAYRLIDNRVSESEIDFDIEQEEMNDIDFDFSEFDMEIDDTLEEPDTNELDDDTIKSNVIATINCGTMLNYDTIKERLENLVEEINGSLALKMQ